mgnify:CR=1 FL=1
MGPKAMNDDRADQKYELTARSCEVDGRTLRQIRALRDVAGVGRGDFGGWLESEDNLSQEGDCWVGDAARVYAEARVTGCAVVDGAARVVDRARVEGFACARIRPATVPHGRYCYYSYSCTARY